MKITVALLSVLVTMAAMESVLRVWDIADVPVFEADVDYGYLPRPDQSVSPRGYRFYINHAGLRGPDFAVRKNSDVLRIVFVGDSVTFGGGRIRETELFTNRVGVFLRSVDRRPAEVINAAVPGWGIPNIAAFLDRRGFVDADLIVWVIPTVDFSRPKTSWRENGFLTVKFPSRLMYLAYYGLFAAGGVPLERGTPSSPQASVERNVETLSASLQTLMERGIRGALVMVPSAQGWSHNDCRDLARFRGVAAALDIPTLILDLQTEGAREYFDDAVHLSPAGHDVVARVLGPFLRDVLGGRVAAAGAGAANAPCSGTMMAVAPEE